MIYALLVEPAVHNARKYLPGNMRQRIKRTIDDLAHKPRPPASRDLDITGLEIPRGVEVRRLRMDDWRLIYAVNDDERWVWVQALHRRPPYDYEDLRLLVSGLEI